MPNATFIPVSLIPHTTSEGKNVFYVSRDKVGSIYLGSGALVIDLASLGVSVANMPRIMSSQRGDEADCFISHRGELFALVGALRASVLTIRKGRFPGKVQPFVKTKDKVFLPTMTGWDEINFENDTYHNLCDRAVPLHRLGLMRFAPSAYYGIVGWEYDQDAHDAQPQRLSGAHRRRAKPDAAQQKPDKSRAEIPPTNAAKSQQSEAKGAAIYALSEAQKRDIINQVETFLADVAKSVQEYADDLFGRNFTSGRLAATSAAAAVLPRSAGGASRFQVGVRKWPVDSL